MCFFCCFIYVYPRASRDVKGNKDRKDVLTTYAVAWPVRCRFHWLLQSLPSKSFSAYFRPIFTFVNPWTGHPSKTEPWATPVSTSSFTREAPIAQDRDMPPLYRVPARLLVITDEQGTPKSWLQYGCRRRGRTLEQHTLTNSRPRITSEQGR